MRHLVLFSRRRTKTTKRMEKIRELVRDALGVGAWACVGVIIRYWLEEMSKFNGFPGFPDLYANLVGTVLLGFAVSHKNLLSRSPPTSVGITTGLCGSITTFSSWQFHNAAVLTDWFNMYSTWENILISITNQIVGVSACISAFLLGRHLAMTSPKNNDHISSMDEEPKAKIEFFVYLFALIATTGLTLSLGFATDITRLDLPFAIFFAPMGAMIRWGVSKVFNKPERYGNYQLPYGTLIVNISGVLLLAMIEVIRQENRCFSDSGEAVKGGISVGFATGFCGCLTTVSTWISELHTLSIRRAYIYGLLSIGLAQTLLIAILGGYRWSHDGEWIKCP